MKIWQYVPIASFTRATQDRINIARFKKPSNVEHVLLTKSPIDNQNRNAITCSILKDNPKDVWIDVDAKVLNWWSPPDDGYVHLNFSTTVIFPNGNGDVFNILYEEFIKTDRQCRWMLPQLKKLRSKLKLIPEGKFLQPIREPGDICEFKEGNALCKLNILKKYGRIMDEYLM